MSLTQIKAKSQGFTIVELLIVVVVIAILAAITIVSYNGITSRANQSAAKASASTVQKKAELYAADSGNNRYPIDSDTPAFPGTDSSKSWYFSGITANYATASLTSSSGNSTVRILKCGSGTPATQSAVTSSTIVGMKVFYWDPAKSGGAGEVSIDVGTTSGTGIACPTS